MRQTWWQSKIERMNRFRNSRELLWFVQIGKLEHELVARKEVKTIAAAGLTIARELEQYGEVLSLQRIYSAHKFVERYDNRTIKRLAKTGMPVAIAARAAYWDDERLSMAKLLAKKEGWKAAWRVHCMRKDTPRLKTEKRQNGHNLAARNEENEDLNIMRLKEKGEWKPERIVNLMAHWMKQMPDFQQLIEEAKRLAGV